MKINLPAYGTIPSTEAVKPRYKPRIPPVFTIDATTSNTLLY